jgi:hypothetical protein
MWYHLAVKELGHLMRQEQVNSLTSSDDDYKDEGKVTESKYTLAAYLSLCLLVTPFFTTAEGASNRNKDIVCSANTPSPLARLPLPVTSGGVGMR